MFADKLGNLSIMPVVHKTFCIHSSQKLPSLMQHGMVWP